MDSINGYSVMNEHNETASDDLHTARSNEQPARHAHWTTHSGSRSAMIGLFPLFSLKKSIIDAITQFLGDIFEAIVSNLLGFFSGLIKEFLFFPRPSTVSGLESVQQDAIVVFSGLLLIGWLAFLLDIQIFPYSTKSDPYRLLERTFAGVVMVVAGPPVLDYAVVLTSAIGKYFYPSDLGSEATEVITSNPGGSLIAVLMLLALGTTLIFVVAAFFVILSIRMFLVYVLFALLPLFAAFWIFDTGVGKYAKKTADMFFKATGMILVAGILISAVLKVGFEIATVDPSAVTTAGAAGTQCLDGMSIGGTCVLEWGQLFGLIGIGGAMTVSTTLAMLGVGTLMGGSGMGSVAAGAVGGIAAGAMGKTKSAVGGSASGAGGGEEAGAGPGAGGPGDEGGGMLSGRQAELSNPGDGAAARGVSSDGGVSGGRTASLDAAPAGGAPSTVATRPSSGDQRAPTGRGGAQGGQTQEEKSTLDKAVEAVDAGSKIGGAVSKVDPVMGAAAGLATGAFKFRQEGGFKDVKQASVEAGSVVKDEATDLVHDFEEMTGIGDHEEKRTTGRIGEQTGNDDQMDWQ